MCSSHLQIFVLFIIGCTASPLEPYFRSDYKYVSRQDAFYKVGRIGERWKEAYARCAAEGAQLAYPRSEAEATLFVTLMSENLPKSANSMWVGAHDQFAEGVYQNLDGEDISDMYDNWHAGEPNDASFNEDCISISRDTTINDLNCNIRLPAICKKSSHSILASNPTCETVDTAYVPDPEGGRCYKIHSQPKNWSQAYFTCHAEQSYLAEVNSQKEADFLVKLMQQYPEDKLKGNFDKVHIAVGFNDLFIEGEYMTSHGKTLQEAGYVEWNGGQPDNYLGNENCGSIYRNGKLNDINCGSRMMFICEKEVGGDPNAVDLFNISDPAPFFRKEYTYDSGTKNFYKLHKDRRNWFDALNRCKLEGAALLVPESKADRDAAVKLLNEKFPAFPGMPAGYNTVWIGISDQISEGDFVTTDGRSISNIFIDWADGEPNNSNNEDCGVLRTTGKMNDVQCDAKGPYICKKSRASLEWNNLCELPDLKYSYDQTLDKCYKLHLTPKNWTAAYEVCTAEDSYLAIINSKQEAEYLVRLVDEATKNKSHFAEAEEDHEGFLPSAVYLGIHKHFLTGWTTVRGQDFDKVGYSNWANGQPDKSGKELCGSMFLNGTLNDLTCDHTAIFICEHDLESSSFPIDERFNNETTITVATSTSTTTTLQSSSS